MSDPTCVQWIEGPNGTRRCSRKATHVLLEHPMVTTCTQHARGYDVPIRPFEDRDAVQREEDRADDYVTRSEP